MSGERLKEILKLKNLGKSTKEIATKLQVSDRTIQRDLEKVRMSAQNPTRLKIVGDINISDNLRIFHSDDISKMSATRHDQSKQVSVAKTTMRQNVVGKFQKNSGKGGTMTERELNSIETIISFAIKLFLIASIIIFITYGNYQFGKLDSSLKNYPDWLLFMTFGILEISIVVMSGLKLSGKLKKTGRFALIACISIFSVFASNTAFVSENRNKKVSSDLLDKNIAMYQDSIELEKKFIKNNKNKWLVNSSLKRLKSSEKNLHDTLIEKQKIEASRGLKTNERDILIFRGLLLLILIFISPFLREDIFKVRQVLISGGC